MWVLEGNEMRGVSGIGVICMGSVISKNKWKGEDRFESLESMIDESVKQESRRFGGRFERASG